MKVRKLLVTDISCRCGARPGDACRTTEVPFIDFTYGGTHASRIAEHAELERAGWEWQEVDPRDAGAARGER